jgi:hypothetical protein
MGRSRGGLPPKSMQWWMPMANPFTVKLKSTGKCLSDTNGVTCRWFAGTSVSGANY